MQNQNIKTCRMKFRGQTSTGMSGSFNPPRGSPGHREMWLVGYLCRHLTNGWPSVCAYVIYLVTSTPDAAYVGTGLGWQKANRLELASAGGTPTLR